MNQGVPKYGACILGASLAFTPPLLAIACESSPLVLETPGPKEPEDWRPKHTLGSVPSSQGVCDLSDSPTCNRVNLESRIGGSLPGCPGYPLTCRNTEVENLFSVNPNSLEISNMDVAQN